MIKKNILKNKIDTSKIPKNKGFVILFAILLSSIILAISLGVGSISLKEIKFSTSAKDANDAFFAADTGAECALFNDKTSVNSFTEGGSGIVECLGKVVTLEGTYPSWSFVLTGLGNKENGCVKVSVDKSVLPTTTIISKGYNNGGSSCVQTSTSIERQLELNY